MKKRDIIKRKNDVTIAVIDDGIESEEYLCFDLEVIGCSVEQRKYKEKNEELTHGTLCYKVLREYGNGCNIGSIKIMGNNREEDVLDAFIVAVKWCVENYIDIIHISLGICSVNAYTQLRNALAEFFVQGGLIVASIDNTEKYTLPAAFSFVFAVRRNDTLKQGEIQMEYSEKYGKNIMEIGTVCMLEKYERLRLVRCNSYTTPVLTAEISRLIRSKQKNFYKVKKYFYNHKENIYRPDFIQNVIIFGTKEKSDKWIFFSIIKYVESIKQISDYKIKRRYILFIRKNIKISELKKLKKNLIAIFYPQKRDKILYLVTLILIIGGDQFTKHLVSSSMQLGQSQEIIDNFFYFTYAQNTGVAWGMLAGHLELFIIIALLSAIFMIYFFTKTKSREVLTRFGLVLTFAGMAGNLIDRIVLGYVRDFIDFVIFNYNFPIFNIADIAVVIGVILIIFEIIFEERIHGKN